MEQQQFRGQGDRATEKEIAPEGPDYCGNATWEWVMPRIIELELRFKISTPELVARALGISVEIAVACLKDRR